MISKYIYIKGPLQYLFRPLLGKNEFAVTQHMYAFIGPNLDNIHWGQVWFSLWRHRTTPHVTWSETEKCVFTSSLTFLSIISCTVPFHKPSWGNLSMRFGLRSKIKNKNEKCASLTNLLGIIFCFLFFAKRMLKFREKKMFFFEFF